MPEPEEVDAYLRGLSDEELQLLHQARRGDLTFYEASIPDALIVAELRRRGLR